jgi:hypothetical protein
MRAIAIAGILLIIFGAIVLVTQGISYTKREKVLDIGPIEAERKVQKTIPISPVIGGVMLAGGIALLALKSRSA